MSQNAPPPKLPLFATVLAAYAGVFRNSLVFLQLAWLPSAVIILLAVAANAFSAHIPLDCVPGQPIDPGKQWQHDLTTLAVSLSEELLSLPFFAWIAVAWHRFILLGDRPATPYQTAVGSRIWLYALWAFFLAVRGSLLSFLPALAAGMAALLIVSLGTGLFNVPTNLTGELDNFTLIYLAPAITAIPVLILGPFLLARQMLALPAMAIGESNVNRTTVLTATQGNYWRLLAGLIMSALPLGILNALWQWYAAAPSLGQAAYPWLNLNSMVEILSTAVAAGFLSLAYRHFFPSRLVGK